MAQWHFMNMEQSSARPRKRLTVRVSAGVRDTLEQAAELLGATVNQFVVQTAYVEAQRVLERESVIRLARQDARKILALLDHPPKSNQRLKEAVKTCRGLPCIPKLLARLGRSAQAQPTEYSPILRLTPLVPPAIARAGTAQRAVPTDNIGMHRGAWCVSNPNCGRIPVRS
jgi:uncharacterized protein (DUF1778 family)